MENTREIFVACAHGSYDDGDDSSDDSSVSTSSEPEPNSRHSVPMLESISRQFSRRRKYPQSIQEIPWYHEGMTRNSAEAVLLTNGLEGSYLLRKSHGNPGQYSVSVRYSDSVKHFSLLHDGYSYTFGIAAFDSLKGLLDHFSCLPIIGGETGGTVTLQYPYYNHVPEPHGYERIERHAEVGRFMGSAERSYSMPDYHIASMEGFLVKLGAIRKSWRKRWFVLRKNELKYYKDKSSIKPIRTIDLECATVVEEEEIPGKINCFYLQLPSRTFHFYASTSREAGDWINMLKWKLDYYKKRNNAEIITDPLASMAR